MTEPWDGTERRATDVRFEKAMADVRALKGGVADLAEAVKIKSDTLHQIMVRIGVGLAILFVAQFLVSLFFVQGLDRHMDTGHNHLACLLTTTPEQKAALGALACK